MELRKYIQILEDSSLPWITDSNGLPKIVYHGTSVSRIRDVTDGKSDIIKEFQAETYFASSREEASSYCGNKYCPVVYEANIWMNRPFHTKDYDFFAEAVHIIPELKSQGYDGVIYGEGNNTQYVVFFPKQIRVLGHSTV